MENFGLISLIPAILVIVLSIWTKKVLEALVISGVVGYVIYYGFGFVGPSIDGLCESMDGDTMWVVLISLLFGALIYLLRESNGTKAFGNIARKYANNPQKSLMFTWLLGIIIFIDDYLSILTSANAMIEVTDEQGIPREMLSYVIDTTSAPVCVIIPISAWVVYFAGIFEKEPAAAFLGDNGLEIYYSIIPYFFYPFLCVLMVPLVIYGIIPKLGTMKKAYDRVRETGAVYSEASKIYNHEITEFNNDSKKVPKLYTFIIPMLVVVVITIWQNDVLWGVLAGIVACAVIYLPTKVMTFDKFSECIVGGIADMSFLGAILVASTFLRNAMLLIGLPDYVIEVASPYMSPNLLPAVGFVVICAVVFVTGSIWSIPAVTTPILVPLAAAVGASIPLTLGAIISAAVFGAHACFYADVTILSSAACRINNMDKALAQLPYALICGIITLIMLIVAGFVLV